MNADEKKEGGINTASQKNDFSVKLAVTVFNIVILLTGLFFVFKPLYTALDAEYAFNTDSSSFLFAAISVTVLASVSVLCMASSLFFKRFPASPMFLIAAFTGIWEIVCVIIFKSRVAEAAAAAAEGETVASNMTANGILAVIFSSVLILASVFAALFFAEKVTNRKQRVTRLSMTAIMISLAFVLSYVQIWKMPFGGTVTLFSMLPIIFIAVKYGIGWGLGASFIYAWLQIIQGEVFGWGLTPTMLIGSLMLDYVVAFSVLGLAGIFRKRGTVGIVAGAASVCVLRFLSHLISGVVLWANFEEFVAFGKSWVNHPWLYSLCYNGAFMLPETIFTLAGVIIVFKLPQLKKFTQPE